MSLYVTTSQPTCGVFYNCLSNEHLPFCKNQKACQPTHCWEVAFFMLEKVRFQNQSNIGPSVKQGVSITEAGLFIRLGVAGADLQTASLLMN